MTTKLMTNLDVFFYNFISNEAKNNKTTKREILEKIIGYYIENKKKKEIEELYKSMGKDEEYLAEMRSNTQYLGNL